MLNNKIETIIKTIPPVFYFISSLAILAVLFMYCNFDLSNNTHSILYVIFTIVNLPVGLGVFFYSYSYMRSFEPKRFRLHYSYLGFRTPIPIDTLWYGAFILIGCLHLISFIVLIFFFILNGFSVPEPLELKRLLDLIVA